MSSKSSKTEAPPSSPLSSAQRDDLPETISVGRVLRPHGVRGEVVVEVLSDVPGRFKKGSRVTGVGGVREGAPPLQLTVVTGRVHKSGAVVRFEGYDSRERAEELRGLDLEIPRSEVPKAKRGTYYHFELLGCRVHEDGQELGRVVEVVEDGGGVMLIVEGEGRRVPVPFVKEILRKVDVAAGRIDVALPEGLLEACASES
ncbi:MAG TPA: ribosome maturation factor RimM [Thermoanaerobaculia bacterium]|jgi:16S rRNA processing protein RimM|nr:ribosome maturation factor RimM [Thermoanaerobaculia bacterium]